MQELDRRIYLKGQEVRLRFINKEDTQKLVDLFYQLSPQTRWLRYHWHAHNFSKEEVWQQCYQMADVDWVRSAAVIATTTNAEGQCCAVGVAQVVRVRAEDTEAEAAIVLRDDFQKKGLGKYLLRTLSDKARQMGMTHIVGWVMPENIYLMKLVRRFGLEVESKTEYGERRVRVTL
ncbi:GNAT family N-acetyltransferase [Anaerolineales bacterium HSG6]|nr:GNAT family N-acetyltransferase [Anaerolineales bacterium HSG6]MDM8531563.1 GNAT family N-acetyltransferase [Anaerolineales bacterium HSG25]